MKYYSCLILLLYLSMDISFSQTHQVYSSVGYSIPTTTAVIGSYRTDNSIEQNLSTFSKGLVFQGGYLLGFNNHIALELNLNYLSGVEEEIYSTLANGDHFKYSNSNVGISTSFIIKYDFGSISPYTKFGASVNFIRIKETQRSGSAFSNFYNEYLYKGDYLIGIIGGVGLNYIFDPSFLIFVECQLSSLTFYPDEIEHTQVYENNRITTKITPKEKFTYEDSTIPIQDYPFSSIILTGGIRIVL